MLLFACRVFSLQGMESLAVNSPKYAKGFSNAANCSDFASYETAQQFEQGSNCRGAFGKMQAR